MVEEPKVEKIEDDDIDLPKSNFFSFFSLTFTFFYIKSLSLLGLRRLCIGF